MLPHRFGLVHATCVETSINRASLRRPRSYFLPTVLLAGAILAALIPSKSRASQSANSNSVPTVVLVHGAWADGSCWDDVISRLQSKGLRVVSVQNPLTTLAEDVAAVERAIALQAGSIVLVGHSWGGTVITQAGNSDKVDALVYVAAFAPDAGESTNAVQKDYPIPGYASLLQADAGGYLHFPQESFATWFAQDLPLANVRVLAATQGPIHAGAFADAVTTAAWRTKPTWYLVTEQDRMIYPALQRAMATRMNARIVNIHSSHVPFLSHPRETTAIILQAVDSVRGR